MQILPSTASEVVLKHTSRPGALKLTDPEVNLKLGVRYLKELERHYRGNKSLALAAYNWGPANLDAAARNNQHVPGSVKAYTFNILQKAIRWQRHFKTAAQHARTFRELALAKN